jgi:hypothetical protein
MARFMLEILLEAREIKIFIKWRVAEWQTAVSGNGRLPG